MNRIHTIALFAGVFAVALGTLGFTGFSSVSAIPLMTEAIPQTQDKAGILGHVTYTLYDATGNVKSYVQGDNVVTFVGKNCIASHIFKVADDGPTGENTCNSRNQDFNFIAIGNVSSPSAGAGDIELDFENGSACASSGGSDDGEMARVQVSPTINNATTGGAVVVLETIGTQAFTFTSDNATIVRQSGLFDGDETADDINTGECTTLGAPGQSGTWNMFSIQDISVTTTDGDSLSIKWTITIG